MGEHHSVWPRSHCVLLALAQWQQVGQLVALFREEEELELGESRISLVMAGMEPSRASRTGTSLNWRGETTKRESRAGLVLWRRFEVEPRREREGAGRGSSERARAAVHRHWPTWLHPSRSAPSICRNHKGCSDGRPDPGSLGVLFSRESCAIESLDAGRRRCLHALPRLASRKEEFPRVEVSSIVSKHPISRLRLSQAGQ